jgi:hypothetical protein
VTRLRLIAGAILLAFTGIAAAQEPPIPAQQWVIEQSALCSAAIGEAERRHHLPPGLLAAIARAESGRPVTAWTDIRPWPWTIDADGEGLFLDSKAAAVVWVRQQTARHKYIDVGCMQVDLAMHPKAFASLEDAFDPASNADYAARYLADLYREAGGDWNVAVGLYHSHTPSLAAAYRDRVALGGTVPLYVRALRQGTLRVPLSSGRSTPINVDRQPAARWHPRLSSCQIARILGPYLNGALSGSRCVQSARSAGP